MKKIACGITFIPHGDTAEARSRTTIVAEVTWQSAEQAVSKKQIVFSRDQREAITALVQMDGLVTGLKGPPGSSKSLILTSIFAALIGRVNRISVYCG